MIIQTELKRVPLKLGNDEMFTKYIILKSNNLIPKAKKKKITITL